MRRATAKKSEPTPVTAEEKDIMHVLHKEHMLVSNLFFEFSQAKTSKQKKELVTKIIDELMAHAEVEQKVVYSALRKDGDDVEEIMDEADTEHHVIELLIGELSKMEPKDDYYDAKVTVLCEVVKHHVDEEEKEIFEKLEDSDLDAEELAQKYLQAKAAFKQKRSLRLVKSAPTARRTAGKRAAK